MASKKQSKGKSRRRHWFRVAVMILSGGFIFPNELTEDEASDTARNGVDDKSAKVK